MPTGEGSVSFWIGGLKAGDEAAASELVDRYLDRLEGYARRLLRQVGASRAVADEQDLAHEAIADVVDGIRKEKYRDLKDREALIRLLLIVTRRRVLRMKRYQVAVRRDSRPPRAADGLRWYHRTEEAVSRIADPERSPEEIVAIREEFHGVLDRLDERDRHLLVLMLDGYTQAEIAGRFGCSKRTVSLRFRRVCLALRELAT